MGGAEIETWGRVKGTKAWKWEKFREENRQESRKVEINREVKKKVKAEVAQGVPGKLRPRIVFTFGATRVVVRQPYAPAAFTPREIPGTHF